MAAAADTTYNTEASSARQQDANHVRLILLGGPGKGKLFKRNYSYVVVPSIDNILNLYFHL